MAFTISSLNVKQVFLLDGIGAFISTILLSVIYYFDQIFGVPESMFKQLIVFPVVFAIFSFTCFSLSFSKWSIFLSIIAVCNVAYAVYSLLLVYQYRSTLTAPGVLYFIIETVIILLIVFLELRYVLKRKSV